MTKLTLFTCTRKHRVPEITAFNHVSQEEECQENFIKKCFIQYGKTAQNVTVTVCRTPLVKDCDLPGEEVMGNKDLTT